MYVDLILYCWNVKALAGELMVKLPQYVLVDETGVTFLIPKTPTVRRFNESLALVRLTDAQVDTLAESGLENLQVLGTYEQVFADPEKRIIYDRVYPRTPEIAADGSFRIPPERFGEIAQ